AATATATATARGTTEAPMTNALAATAPSLTAAAELGIELRQLQSGEEGLWDRFVTSSASGTFFHLSGWKTVVERELGRECIYLAAWRGCEMAGVLPISRVRSRLFGDCLVSMPLGVYGGVCADDRAPFERLVQAGGELANRLGVKYLELRNRTEQFPSNLP